MLGAVKRVEYHAGSNSLNFFFTRIESTKWEEPELPLRQQKIRLADVNQAQTQAEKTTDKVNVWTRQPGAGGVKNSERTFRYWVHLLNMASLLGVGHFLAALKAKLGGGEMTAYSIDTPGSLSERSQHWEIQFCSSECLPGLAGVYRIYRTTHPTLVHHVSTHRQPPCLVCGISGHLDRECAASPVELTKSNCIVFTQEGLAQSTTTKTASFTSAEEMRAAFATHKAKPKATGEAEQTPEVAMLMAGVAERRAHSSTGQYGRRQPSPGHLVDQDSDDKQRLDRSAEGQ
ncbi:hypothetical protein PybrP1_008312 [[Pythium] brassicae (nom. inval.)]|nr:hypothetical protein PybrP1_008312 [[Pythium] brassicae (nom. inval.)]